MFPKGPTSRQNETYKSDVPLSPNQQVIDKKTLQSPNVAQSTLQKRLQGLEDKTLHDLSPVDSTCSRKTSSLSGENRDLDCLDDTGPLVNSITRYNENTKNKEEENKVEDEGSDPDSNKLVEHILKELKGINKIQEEISDLRQYLTSVRGSVDEVSCCVDAVLSEIGELYSGASAAPPTNPGSLAHRVRQGSLGRQNAVTCYQEGDEQPNQQEQDHNSNINKKPKFYLELHLDHDCQSASSLSSCQTSSCSGAGFLCADEFERCVSVDMQRSICRGGGWSEEDICSCGNGSEMLETNLGVWSKCAAQEAQSTTSGHSPHDNSEHLSLLFGLHYNSPSSSSSTVDWLPTKLQTKKENLECDCAANCPYSCSSGYYTMDAYPNEMDSGPSRSPSCSTVLLTDADDSYLEPHSVCDDCVSSGDTLDLGSAESLDRELTDHSLPKEDEAEESSQESPESGKLKSPSVHFDVNTFSKAVVSFGSALKGALKTFEGTNHESVMDGIGSEASPSPLRQACEPREDQTSTKYIECKFRLTENLTESSCPNENGKALPCAGCDERHEELSCNLQLSAYTHLTPTKYHYVERSKTTEECLSDGEVSNLVDCPTRQGEGSLGPVLHTDEVMLSPIRENHVLEEVGQEKCVDANHRERITNFQRILKEKRRTRHRLSKSAQGSQGSHGSQCSQGSQSQDEFMPGIFGIFKLKYKSVQMCIQTTHHAVIMVFTMCL